jgi:hypothetical protein
MTDQQSTPAPPPYTATNTIDAVTPETQATATPTNESPKQIPSIEQYWYKKGIFGLHSRATFRILQFIFAVVAAGLYGVDLAHATKKNARAPAEWVYAEMIICFSAMTCVVHAHTTVKRVVWSLWDGVLFVFWLAQVGVFGTIYYEFPIQPKYEEVTQCVPRMKVAVWIGLINMLLWFSTFVLGVAWCIRARRLTRRTDKTGGVHDVEHLGDQENGLGVLRQKCSKKSGGEAGYEWIDGKLDGGPSDTGDQQQKDEK